MEFFYEVKNLFDEKSNRSLLFGRLKKVFTGEVDKVLWSDEIPRLELSDVGEGSDAWGSLRVKDYPADLTQLLACLTATSSAFPATEIHLRCDDCPGFVLDGKTELIIEGRYQRYQRQFAAYCAEHKPATAPWEFHVDPRIWTALVQKNQELSESQILTTQLSRGVAFVHSPKLKEPFLGFPVEYPGLKRKKKELKIPQQLAARVHATCESLKLTRQELTERSVYAGLLK